MEKWKPVLNYEGFYEVSNTGFVRSLDRVYDLGYRKCLYKGKLMQARDNGRGYLSVKLSKSNKARRVMLHRIIAQAFISNPFNYKTVNHKDGDKNNNTISNLEWCTQKQNVEHAIRTGLINIELLKKRSSKIGKKTIIQIAGSNRISLFNTKTKNHYSSIMEAASYNGINRKKLSKMIHGIIPNETFFVIEKYKALNKN